MTLICLVMQSCLTLCDLMDCCPPGFSAHGDSPGKNTGVGCHALLHRTFPIQGLNSRFLHCRWILYHLSHQRSPSILDWVAYPFSRGCSQPRNQIGISCIVGGFFTSWATREVPLSLIRVFILKSILSDMSTATPNFYGSPFTWKIFSPPITFNLFVSLGLKWVSCRQHT